MSHVRVPTLFAATLALSACATRPPASDQAATQEFEQTNDPLEPTNRFFYDVSKGLWAHYLNFGGNIV